MDFHNAHTYRSDSAFVRATMKTPLLDREQEYTLACAWYYDKDEDAFKTLVGSYSRMVISAALRYKHYGLQLSDLIQEGHIGLLHAAQRFNPERDVRFSSYAKWWIRALIQDHVLRNWSIVRTGSTASQKILFFNLNRLRNQLLQVSDTSLSLDHHKEIATQLGVALRDVEAMEERLFHHDFSLSTTIHDAGENEWVSILRDERINPEEASFLKHDTHVRHQWINQAIQTLNKRERYVIIKRYLVDPSETLESLGGTLSITKERVRQIETKAMRRMKHFFLTSFHEARQAIDLKDT